MNPYAPPGDPAGMADRALPSTLGRGAYLARLDPKAANVLVVGLGTEFPSVCLKCASHQDITRRAARFQWTPTWARASVLLCALGGLVAMALTTRRAQLSIPLCSPCNQRWSKARNAVIFGVIALVLSLAALRFSDEPRTFLPLVAVVVVGFVVMALAYVRPRMLQARRIDDKFIELKGLHADAAQEIAEGSAS